MRVHAELCHSNGGGILFVPLIVETMGGGSDQAVINSSHILVTSWDRDWEAPNLKHSDTIFNGLPSPCGWVMQPFGSTDRQPSQLWLMD